MKEPPLVKLPLERYPVSFLRDPALRPVDRGAVAGYLGAALRLLPLRRPLGACGDTLRAREPLID